MDVYETASPDDVSLYRVVPACIATKEGGATPKIDTQYTNKLEDFQVWLYAKQVVAEQLDSPKMSMPLKRAYLSVTEIPVIHTNA